MTQTTSTVISHADWIAEATQRFGTDTRQWRFVCPSCGHTQSIQDFLDAGIDLKTAMDTVYFSCIGRLVGGDDAKTFQRAGGPCTYAGGGLFRINPVQVQDGDRTIGVFAFADPTA